MALESDSRRPSSKVIARIACIEIPRNQWQDLIRKLVDNMARPSSSLKEATLEVLEYVFEGSPYLLKGDQGDLVKASVVNAVKNHAGEISSQVRLAAVKALLNVLRVDEFARFKDHAGRNSVVAVVCDAAECNETEIKEVAFECLVAIASRYHTNLEPYKEIILSLTSQALKGDVESLKVKSIELWSTICQQEVDYQQEEEDLEEEEEEEEETSNFIGSLSSFVPLLLETYLKEEENLKQEDISMGAEQEGDDNLEDMDISMSEEQEGDENVEQEGVNLEDIWGQEGDEAVEGIYMTCLGLAARTMKDAVVPLVMQFVECSISGPHCHSRKVAIFPLAFILEGPSVKQLAPVVHLLLDMMKDPEEGVRGRAAWTLALVFELVGANKIIRNEGGLPGIMAILIERSKDVPQVSIEVYRALYFLVRGYGENAKSKSCELSPFVKPLIDALLCASELAKENPFRLPACTSAYEALSEIVRVCNIEELEVCRAVGGLMSQIFRRLNIMINRQGEAVSSVERKNRGLLEVLLCGLLELLIWRLGTSYLATSVAFTLNGSAKCVLLLLCIVLTSDSNSARDGAALASGALAHAIGGEFVQHMPIMLQYFNVKRLSPVYLEVMCDICRVLGKEEEAVPSYDHIMEVLYQGILESTLQPSILSSFGQIALAIGEKFEKYLPLVMEKLREAAELNPEDNKDHGNKVREGIFKAYHGILGGINDQKSGLKVAMALVDFTEGVCKDHSKIKTRDGRNTSVAMAGIDALSQLPSRAEA
ncbi:hypothetical protein VPH35_040097 [Triticum aestivum]|uniref:importin subunit beta-1-like n=1 Tax=Triticum aestivum TaxID=4565 RepID=UPI001D035B62|nr:importin subunit beta-1-like [Triticum aestivum]